MTATSCCSHSLGAACVCFGGGFLPIKDSGLPTVTIVYGILAFSVLLFGIGAHFKRLSSRVYLLYSMLFICLSVLKPFGSSPDDHNYVELVRQGCTTFECGYEGAVNRDFIWFALVSLSNYGGEFVAIKLVSATALSLKLFVIFKLSRNKIYGLSAYAFLFFFLHDLTQYRVSLALAFYLLFVYVVVQQRKLLPVLPILLSIGSHIQSAPAIVVYLVRKYAVSRIAVVIVGSVLVALIAAGAHPRLEYLESLFLFVFDEEYNPRSDIGKYVQLAEVGGYFDFRSVSLSAVLVLLALTSVKLDVGMGAAGAAVARCLSISLASILFAYVLYWAFASVVDMQNRFFDYFLVPIVLLFGNLKHGVRNYAILGGLCTAFFLKYHVISVFFTQ